MNMHIVLCLTIEHSFYKYLLIATECMMDTIE